MINLKNVLFGCLSFFVLSFNVSATIVGVGGHPEGFHKSSDEYVKILSDYNIASFRTDYSWDVIEKKKGVFDVNGYKTDQVLQELLKRKITPVIILDYGNALYNITRPLSDSDIDHFLNYVQWVAKRFNNDNVIFEVWNEWSRPSLNYQDSQSEKSAGDYFKLVKETSKKIKSINPNAKIVAGGFNPIDAKDTQWGLFLIKLGLMHYVDGVSIHPYSYSSRRLANPELNLTRLSDVNSYYKRHNPVGGDVDFYITEMGFSNFEGGVRFTELDVGGLLKEYYTLAEKQKFIKGVWWYDLIDDGRDKNNMEHNFGLLDNNLQEKPAAKSFKLLKTDAIENSQGN